MAKLYNYYVQHMKSYFATLSKWRCDSKVWCHVNKHARLSLSLPFRVEARVRRIVAELLWWYRLKFAAQEAISLQGVTWERVLVEARYALASSPKRSTANSPLTWRRRWALVITMSFSSRHWFAWSSHSNYKGIKCLSYTVLYIGHLRQDLQYMHEETYCKFHSTNNKHHLISTSLTQLHV